MKLFIIILPAVLSFAVFAVPNFIPTSVYPSTSGYEISNGHHACHYPELGVLGHFSPSGGGVYIVPVGTMGMYIDSNATRLGTVICNVDIDNSRAIENIVINVGQQVDQLVNAAECKLHIDARYPGISHQPQMDAVFYVPGQGVVQYIYSDVNSLLVSDSEYIQSVRVSCNLTEGITTFSISNVGVSYY